MQTLNRKILSYLLALWAGMAALGAIGYTRLNAVQNVSQNLLNGAEGLSLYQEQSRTIDLVISDLVMPELGGMDLCREMQQVNPRVKMLFISGYSPEEQRARFDGAVVGFLQKPFDLSTLARLVRKALDGVETPA